MDGNSLRQRELATIGNVMRLAYIGTSEMLSKRNAERNGSEYVFHRKGHRLNDLYLTHRFKQYVIDLGVNLKMRGQG